jgi:hypothetical protein
MPMDVAVRFAARDLPRREAAARDGRFLDHDLLAEMRLILSATVRATVSLPPPAAAGTSSVIGRDG